MLPMMHGAPAMHAELNNNYFYTFLLFCVLPCLALIIADTSSPSQDDSKFSKKYTDDGFWLIGSETTDPFEADSFSFEASDPFQPLPCRAQLTKLGAPLQKHRSEENYSETKPSAVEIAMTYDALHSYSVPKKKSSMKAEKDPDC